MEIDGQTWYEIAADKCGQIRPAGSKAPSERSTLAAQTQLFDLQSNLRLYTMQGEDGTYYLYFRNVAECGNGRMILAWITPDGEYCAQAFLMN